MNKTNALIGFQVPSILKITDTTASNIENVQVGPGSTIDLGGSLISGKNFLQFDLEDANIVPNGVLNLQVSFLWYPGPHPRAGAAAGVRVRLGRSALSAVDCEQKRARQKRESNRDLTRYRLRSR